MSCYLHHPLKYYGKCEEKLGSGEYGFIRRFTKTEDNDPNKTHIYATKFHQSMANMLREIYVLLKCKEDPYIVNVIDVGYCSNRGKYYHVMPIATGDLYVQVKDGTFTEDPESLRKTFYQIVRGLHALHVRGIMHRDIKAENILTLENKENEGEDKEGDRSIDYVLCDFGLAKGFGIPGEIFTDYMLTRCYRSPENHAREENYSFGVDIWSLGCLFCEMALQEIPFDTSSSEDSIQWMWAVFGTPELRNQLEYLESAASSLKKNKKNKYRRRWETDFLQPIRERYGSKAEDFLLSMFKLEPSQRATTTALLSHPYFTESSLCSKSFPLRIEATPYQPQDWTSYQSDFGFPDRNVLFLELYEVAREYGLMSSVIYKCYGLLNRTLCCPQFAHMSYPQFRNVGYVLLDFCSKLYGCESFAWKYYKPLKKKHKTLKNLERKILSALKFDINIYTGYDMFWNSSLKLFFPSFPEEEVEQERLRSIYKISLFHKKIYFEYTVSDLLQAIITDTNFYETHQTKIMRSLPLTKAHKEFKEDFELLLET